MTGVRAAEIIKLADNLSSSTTHELDDSEMQKNIRKVSFFKFSSEKDIEDRFPDDLKHLLKYEKQGDVYTLYNRIILTQPQIFDVLDGEFGDLPSSTGVHRLWAYLGVRYLCISSNQVRKYLATEDNHLRWRQRRRSQLTKVKVAKSPLNELGLDITFLPKGMRFKYILVITDLFSKYIWAVLLNDQSMANQVEALRTIVDSLPTKPSYIRSDNAYRAQEFVDYANSIGVKMKFGRPANPLGQGQTERANRTIKEMFLSYLDEDRGRNSIKPALTRVLQVYNASPSTATGFRPRDIIDPECPAAVIKEVKQRLMNNGDGRDVNAKYNFPLHKGDKVKIDVLALDNKIAQLKKAHQYKASHEPTYSDDDYTVDVVRSDGLLSVKEIQKRFFMRGQLLYVVPIEDDEERRKFVTEWQGERDDTGRPIGKEDLLHRPV
jgi:transposase InsO family protein